LPAACRNRSAHRSCARWQRGSRPHDPPPRGNVKLALDDTPCTRIWTAHLPDRQERVCDVTAT
jgi:hypothetical protein